MRYFDVKDLNESKGYLLKILFPAKFSTIARFRKTKFAQIFFIGLIWQGQKRKLSQILGKNSRGEQKRLFDGKRFLMDWFTCLSSDCFFFLPKEHLPVKPNFLGQRYRFDFLTTEVIVWYTPWSMGSNWVSLLIDCGWISTPQRPVVWLNGDDEGRRYWLFFFCLHFSVVLFTFVQNRVDSIAQVYI